MSERLVSDVYDALQTFESRRKPGRAYPVHKALSLDTSATHDIYDWIMHQIALPEDGEILDAGCGVGFGAIKLARSSTCRVTGISLSANEIASARQAITESGLANRLEFSRQSFDTLPRSRYDLVIAVESLKHSTNLARTLQTLRKSVRPGGQLAIVEDLYNGSEHDASARKLKRDWSLTSLYRESDYIASLESSQCRVLDLTANVPLATPLSLRSRRLALGLMLPFARATTATVLRAFRGGLYLESLYASGAMAYKAILCRFGER